MRPVTSSVLVAVLVGITLSGCMSKKDYDTCVRRNATLSERIDALLAAQEGGKMRADRCGQENADFRQQAQLMQQQIEALKATLQAKQATIAQLTEQLSNVTPTALPVELSNALADWAMRSGSDLITYDEKSGVVQFKSDLLFDSGSAVVKPQAAEQLNSLADIINSSAAAEFDILVVGHTDDQPIRRAAAKHPTNWHLSVHRAIGVEKILAEAGVSEFRLAVMGMGEFQPLEPNPADKSGNAKNRRVEIYIVPTGHLPSLASKP